MIVKGNRKEVRNMTTSTKDLPTVTKPVTPYKASLADRARVVLDKAIEILDGSPLSEIKLHFGEDNIFTVLGTPKGVTVLLTDTKDENHYNLRELLVTDEVFAEIEKARKAKA